ncbi:TetR/AcrR family transcriptional regulator [Paenibacillus mucilaginosus]|uniref:Putative transcriptional regulator n=1 Tax=Paenibacillus mucilaginosus (strain KNP414) TaxID=1036673 RepID=F8FJB4_PAEMK|nr:TetR/AcrR family transcriptional regulator [Paenibacillus mucilaginosus]AEI39877.1 putative transcriptional regulator [Paenibacillus mucilaginosus KNP414]MCG7217198.1 TetR/AcrR family transcriptional regulator [Paenibacillus mucilaginosus]WDM29155.1 TetR family transcriptional regulator [Paenibacillus mucilaginosus]
MPKVGMEPKRRAEVINATLTCISLHGIDGMTLDKVAEYADCSKGVVTYYYKNKDHLTIEAFKAFMAYYGLKIESELRSTMTAGEMIGVTMDHILPPYREDADRQINVSQLDGMENMYIPFEDQARLFVQFFSKAALDPKLQEVVSERYQADLKGIARIMDYGRMTGHMAVEDSQSAAYGLLAMVVGLSFFRVAKIPPVHGEDNRYIGEDYVRRLTSSQRSSG